MLASCLPGAVFLSDCASGECCGQGWRDSEGGLEDTRSRCSGYRESVQRCSQSVPSSVFREYCFGTWGKYAAVNRDILPCHELTGSGFREMVGLGTLDWKLCGVVVVFKAGASAKGWQLFQCWWMVHECLALLFTQWRERARPFFDWVVLVKLSVMRVR